MVANKVHADMKSALSAISKLDIVSHETLLRKFKEFTVAGNKTDQNPKQADVQVGWQVHSFLHLSILVGSSMGRGPVEAPEGQRQA